MSVGDQDNGQTGRQIGQILERKRLEKGLSLKEVEHATKIRTRYLEGLEREDPTMLPDPVYAQGFLKTYANFLGLEGEQLSRELKDRRAPRRERQLDFQGPTASASEFDRPLITPGGLGGAERRRISGATILTIALAVLVLAGVIGSLYYVGSRSAGGGAAEDAPEEPAEQQASQAPSQDGPATETTTATGTNAAGSAGQASGTDEESTVSEASPTSRVTVKVFNNSTGMTLLADGTVVYDGIAQPGFSQTFEVRRVLTVSAKNGGAVEVEVGGQNLGRVGGAGQPATRDFPVQPAG
jgi:cytoskeleton protein RodZ